MKNIDKGNKLQKKQAIKSLVLYASIYTAIATPIVVGAFSYDESINHTEEICPYIHSFGVEHQISKIKEAYPNLEVFTNETRNYHKHIPTFSEQKKLTSEYVGYEYIPEYGIITPVYENYYEKQTVKGFEDESYSFTASENEILLVDPKEVKVVKVLKLK